MSSPYVKSTQAYMILTIIIKFWMRYATSYWAKEKI